MRNPAKFITSLFYMGHVPLMPGTVGSLVGLGLYLFVKDTILIYGFSIIFLFVIGLVFSGEAEKIYKAKDARMIIIDEACGMLLALYLVPYRISLVILGFIIFRILDVIKVPPARQLEALPGAWGVMLDDVCVAIYTNLILQILARIP